MDFRIVLVTLFDFIIIAKNVVESLSDIADKRAKRIIIRKVFERRSRITFFIIRVIIRYYIDRGISIFTGNRNGNIKVSSIYCDQ